MVHRASQHPEIVIDMLCLSSREAQYKQQSFISTFVFRPQTNVLQNVRKDTKVVAANGQSFPAVQIFSLALRYLSQQVRAELTDCGSDVPSEALRWVITVPAIWSQAAKQIIREAAYQVNPSLNYFT